MSYSCPECDFVVECGCGAPGAVPPCFACENHVCMTEVDDEGNQVNSAEEPDPLFSGPIEGDVKPFDALTATETEYSAWLKGEGAALACVGLTASEAETVTETLLAAAADANRAAAGMRNFGLKASEVAKVMMGSAEYDRRRRAVYCDIDRYMPEAAARAKLAADEEMVAEISAKVRAGASLRRQTQRSSERTVSSVLRGLWTRRRGSGSIRRSPCGHLRSSRSARGVRTWRCTHAARDSLIAGPCGATRRNDRS